MLPEALSNGACSLVPGQDRLAVTVELEFEGAKVAPHRVPPLADPLRRAARLPAGRPRLRRRGARRGAVGGAARRPRAGGRGARRRRARRAARSRSSPVEPEFDFSREGHVDRARAERADRVAPADRAPDDRRQRGGRDAARDAQAARALPRARAARAARASSAWSTQLASLDVPTPPLPETMTPQQAGDAGRRDLAARRRSRCAARGHGRAALTSLVLRSLKQAHYSPQQPRPRRAALAALLPLHLADPPLPGPRSATARCWPRSAPARTPPRASRHGGRGRVVLDARARRDGDRARAPTTSRAASCSRPSCSSAAGRPSSPGEVIGRDRRGRVRRLRRRLRGHAAGAPPARRLVGAQRARDDARRRAVGQGAPARRPGRRAGRAASTRRAGAWTSRRSRSPWPPRMSFAALPRLARRHVLPEQRAQACARALREDAPRARHRTLGQLPVTYATLVVRPRWGQLSAGAWAICSVRGRDLRPSGPEDPCRPAVRAPGGPGSTIAAPPTVRETSRASASGIRLACPRRSNERFRLCCVASKRWSTSARIGYCLSRKARLSRGRGGSGSGR